MNLPFVYEDLNVYWVILLSGHFFHWRISIFVIWILKLKSLLHIESVSRSSKSLLSRVPLIR